MKEPMKWSKDGKHLMLRGDGFGVIIDMSDLSEPLLKAIAYLDGENIQVGTEFKGKTGSFRDDFFGKILRAASRKVKR